MKASARALLPSRWPALARFFRGYLHQDAGLEHRSVAAAFEQFWADASPGERDAFLAEWQAVRRSLTGRTWHRVEPVLLALGAAWLPGKGRLIHELTDAVQRTAPR